MGYDRGDSFHFDFEPNGIRFGSKSIGKLSPRSNSVQFGGIISYFSECNEICVVYTQITLLLYFVKLNNI